MRKYNFIFMSLTVLTVLFSCNASTVIIDGTFEGIVGGKTVVFHLKRQVHDNSVLGMLKSDLVLSSHTVPSGTVFTGTLYDAKDFIVLRVYVGRIWNFRVLDNGARLESAQVPKVFFRRK